VAHGYLALALVAPTAMDLGAVPPDASAGLNYGLDKVRFLAPVKAGARVRNRVVIASAEPQNPGRLLVKLHCTLEIENESKPALIAEMLVMLIAKP
jgi:acyl dehydratase